MTPSSTGDDAATLKIGAVARLTGLSVHTLRKWEDRYAAVEPRRSEGGERVYTRVDLKRLALMKRLADAGLSLRELAKLSLEELEKAWEETGATLVVVPDAAIPDKIPVAILGDVLPTLLGRTTTATARIQVVASGDSEPALRRNLGETPVDLLLYECQSVQHETRRRVTELMKALPVRGVIVVYRFGASGHVSALRQPNVALTRAPVDLEELDQIARDLLFGIVAAPPRARDEVSRLLAGDVSPPRLSMESIARIATSAPRMRCECPHHLADIVLSLRAFEEYSETCENRNAEDADLHHFLWVSAANARALFEDAIVRVAEAEGIPLED